MSESIGSFYVLKSKSHKTGWRILRESYIDGKRMQKSVPQSAWASMGILPTMSIEQVRTIVRQLNAQNAVERAEVHSRARIADRISRDKLHHAAYIPAELNKEFIKWLDENVTGSPTHLPKMVDKAHQSGPFS